MNDRVRFVALGMDVRLRHAWLGFQNSSPLPALTNVSRLRGILAFTKSALQSLSESEGAPRDL